MAGVDVDIDFSPMLHSFSPANVKRAVGLVTQVVANDSNEYVPVATGTLQGSMKVDVGQGNVIWDKKYAGIVYNRDHVISAGNPLGTPHWVEHAEKAHGQEWADVVGRALVGDL